MVKKERVTFVQLKKNKFLQAIIFKSTGSWYIVKTIVENTFWKCRIKGKFKIDKNITSTNPIAVGDVVEIEVENEGEQSAMIVKIVDRKNYIVRVSPHNKNLQHIIASNIQQALLIASIHAPRTSLGFIDRFLLTAEMYNVHPIIIFNKLDTLQGAQLDLLQTYMELYQKIGYQVIATSALQPESVAELASILQNKQTLFTGHSGVGKSTLINALQPGLSIRTLPVSLSSGKGMHTTTYAEMFELNATTTIIDTPGIRELGIVTKSKEEVGGYYPEIRNAAKNCKYNNCMHINEPHCAVQQAIINNEINPMRYESYLSILATIDDKNY